MYGLSGFWKKNGSIWANILVPNRKWQSEVSGHPTERFPKRCQKRFPEASAGKVGVFDLKQLFCLRNPIVQTIRGFSKDETLKEVVTSPLTKDLDEELKHVQKAITIVDRPKNKVVATMKKYCTEKPESTYVQLRLFTRNSKLDKFQQLVFVNYKYDEFLCLLDAITSISVQVLSNQSLCNIV